MASNTGADWSFPTDLPGGWAPESAPQPSPAQHKPPTEEKPTPTQPPKRRRTHYPPRKCRICLEDVPPTFHTPDTTSTTFTHPAEPRVTYTSPDSGRLLSPCKCKGTQRYVHEACLAAWRRADPLQQRNYWECPTCGYRYHLQRLTWARWISGTAAQLGVTLAIFLLSTFALGFVADPIINMYFDPYHTLTSGGGPGGSLLFEDEPTTWAEHFAKGMASLGLLGFAKFLFSLSPFQLFRTGGFGGGARNVGGNGRDRLAQISWITIAIGVVTFLWAVWKGVRAWTRRTLEQASERVMDVPGREDDDEDDE